MWKLQRSSLFGAKEYAKQVLEQGISIDPFERKVI